MSIVEFPKGTPPAEILRQAVEARPELAWLTGSIEASPEVRTGDMAGQTHGEALLGVTKTEAAEFNRTAMSILTLQWVIQGDYEAFTTCQRPEDRLSRESFAHLQAYTRRILPDEEAVQAMTTFLVINDLGKVDNVIRQIEEETGVTDVDHDRVLAAGLHAKPEISPSFSALSSRYQQIILRGLQTDFNVGQFVQAENVPSSLAGLSGLDQQTLNFYLLHSLFDIAGAAGHAVQNGSAVMTESTYTGFRLALQAVERIPQGSTPIQAYDQYLESRAKLIGMDSSQPEGRAITRVCCMMRLFSPAQSAVVVEVFRALPTNVQAILHNELNMTGVDDGYATLIYYAPAILLNMQNTFAKSGDTDALRHSLDVGLPVLARLFQAGRIQLRQRQGNGVYTVMGRDIATVATQNPRNLNNMEIQLEPKGKDAVARPVNHHEVHTEGFSRYTTLSEVPGQSYGIVAMGGGSDSIQATILGSLLERAGKQVRCIISVRSAKTTSQSPAGLIGENRLVQGHGGEVSEGVFRILPTTTGTGRFLENIAAEGSVPVYLVVDPGDGSLDKRLQAVFDVVGQIDAAMGVDTGGDAFYRVSGQDISKTTPDQDLATLRAIGNLDVANKISCEIAVGVDSPDYVEDLMREIGSTFYELTPEEQAQVLATYKEWRMDGSDDTRYGKTPLAWQAALRGDTGYVCLPLPRRVVLDRNNPWNPFVYVSPSMKGVFFQRIEDHIRALEQVESPGTPS